MTDSWRDRLTVPLYALAMTSAIVLVTGMVVSRPASPGTPPPPPKKLALIQITVDGGRGGQLDNLPVRAELADGTRAADVRLGRTGELSLLVPDENARVCLRLPKGWIGGAELDGTAGDSCWSLTEGHQAAPIALRRGN
jgi:hypothetical protein